MPKSILPLLLLAGTPPARAEEKVPEPELPPRRKRTRATKAERARRRAAKRARRRNR